MSKKITTYNLEYKSVICTGVQWRYPEPHIFYFAKDGKYYEFTQNEYIDSNADTDHICCVIEQQFLPWLEEENNDDKE